MQGLKQGKAQRAAVLSVGHHSSASSSFASKHTVYGERAGICVLCAAMLCMVQGLWQILELAPWHIAAAPAFTRQVPTFTRLLPPSMKGAAFIIQASCGKRSPACLGKTINACMHF